MKIFALGTIRSLLSFPKPESENKLSDDSDRGVKCVARATRSKLRFELFDELDPTLSKEE